MGNRWVNTSANCKSDSVYEDEVCRSKLECSGSEGILCLWKGIVAGTIFLTNREGVISNAQIKSLCRNSFYGNRK